MNDYRMFNQGPKFSSFGLAGSTMTSHPYIATHMASSQAYNRIHSLRTEMPSDVLELFKANEIGFIKPFKKRKCRSLDPVCLNGAAGILARFGVSEMVAEKDENEPKAIVRTVKAEEKNENAKRALEAKVEQWNPFEDTNAKSDPYKTLVVTRLNYATTERGLKHEFEKYGAVKSVRLIKDQQGQSNGYAFVEFERKDDFINAYKNSDQRRVDGRKVCVDFEKGRTMVTWRPRRLGGGDGDLRLTPRERRQRDKQRAILQEERKLREKSRQRSREQRRKKERSREKEREKEREKVKNQEREKQKRREKEDRQDRDRHKEHHKEKKEKERSRSRKKDKKEKKQKKEKKEYVSMKMPVEEFY